MYYLNLSNKKPTFLLSASNCFCYGVYYGDLQYTTLAKLNQAIAGQSRLEGLAIRVCVNTQGFGPPQVESASLCESLDVGGWQGCPEYHYVFYSHICLG